MKVHHDGFMKPQDAYLSADTGLPQADEGTIEGSELANGKTNGSSTPGFHMDVDSPPQQQDEFDGAQG